MIARIFGSIWDHLRTEFLIALVPVCVLFLGKVFDNKKGVIEMDIVKKEFLEGVKLSVEIKEGKLLIAAEAGLSGLVQLADDKIENPIISALLQGLKAVVAKV